MDRPWMRRKPLPCTSPASPPGWYVLGRQGCRTGPGLRSKGVLAVSFCQLLQLTLTFRSCQSTSLTASHSFLGLLSMPGALHKASQTRLRLHSEVWSQAPHPRLSYVTLASTGEVPLPQSSSPDVPGQGYCPRSNGLLADSAAQSCIGTHGSPWILPLSVSRFPVTRASLSPLMNRVLNL
jgi:hypothetical protein